MTAEELAERLRQRWDDVLVARGEVTVTISRNDLLVTLRALRDEPELAFGVLADVSCTDWPGRDPRVWMA